MSLIHKKIKSERIPFGNPPALSTELDTLGPNLQHLFPDILGLEHHKPATNYFRNRITHNTQPERIHA